MNPQELDILVDTVTTYQEILDIILDIERQRQLSPENETIKEIYSSAKQTEKVLLRFLQDNLKQILSNVEAQLAQESFPIF
jgi:hypothetical protein